MPCNHKFQSYLHLERIDFVPHTLVVGSFSPEWPASNTAEWFYGRTNAICFWEILPRLFGEPSLMGATPADWKQFCSRHKIALTDLISSIEDAKADNRDHQKILGGFSDKAIAHHFDDYEFVDIVGLLRKYPSIKRVFITRGITEAFWRNIWNPVAHYCSRNNIQERKLLTPSEESAYHHETYNNEHPGKVIPRLEDYLLMRWRMEWEPNLQ